MIVLSIKNQGKNFSFLIAAILLLTLSFAFTDSKKNDPYDNIVIYKLKYEKKSRRSNGHSLKYKIIHGDTRSRDIKDRFEKNLKKFGYVKVNYDQIKYDQICSKINSFTFGRYKYETSCLHTFRDIFVYKKGNEVVKVIKVCTSCYANEVITHEGEDQLLMDFKDYDSLKELLKQ